MKKLLLLLLFSQQVCLAQRFISPGALMADTSAYSLSLPGREKIKMHRLYVPATMIIAGIALNSSGPESPKMELAEERNEHLLNFRTHIDDYLQYSPVVLAYGLDAFGLKSRRDLANRSAIFFKGEACMLAVTHLLKHSTSVLRPDNSDYASFPSGHTAQAFAAATFLSEEYKCRFRWMPYASYGIASAVGALRIANNKHYISDVLAGAGIGVLSMKLAYWTHRYKWGVKKKYKKP